MASMNLSFYDFQFREYWNILSGNAEATEAWSSATLTKFRVDDWEKLCQVGFRWDQLAAYIDNCLDEVQIGPLLATTREKESLLENRVHHFTVDRRIFILSAAAPNAKPPNMDSEAKHLKGMMKLIAPSSSLIGLSILSPVCLEVFCDSTQSEGTSFRSVSIMDGTEGCLTIKASMRLVQHVAVHINASILPDMGRPFFQSLLLSQYENHQQSQQQQRPPIRSLCLYMDNAQTHLDMNVLETALASPNCPLTMLCTDGFVIPTNTRQQQGLIRAIASNTSLVELNFADYNTVPDDMYNMLLRLLHSKNLHTIRFFSGYAGKIKSRMDRKLLNDVLRNNRVIVKLDLPFVSFTDDEALLCLLRRLANLNRQRQLIEPEVIKMTSNYDVKSIGRLLATRTVQAYGGDLIFDFLCMCNHILSVPDKR